MASLSRTQSSSSIIKVPIDDDLVEEQKEESVRFTDVFKRGRRPVADLDSTATKRSVYDDPNLAPHYWPKKEYENIHRFDPTVRWTVREEKVRSIIVIRCYCSNVNSDRPSFARLTGKLCSGPPLASPPST